MVQLCGEEAHWIVKVVARFGNRTIDCGYNSRMAGVKLMLW